MQGESAFLELGLPALDSVQLLLKLLQHRLNNLLRGALLHQFIRFREQVALQAVAQLAVLRNPQPAYRFKPRSRIYNVQEYFRLLIPGSSKLICNLLGCISFRNRKDHCRLLHHIPCIQTGNKGIIGIPWSSGIRAGLEAGPFLDPLQVAFEKQTFSNNAVFFEQVSNFRAAHPLLYRKRYRLARLHWLHAIPDVPGPPASQCCQQQDDNEHCADCGFQMSLLTFRL
ncbi:hypothetical protein D3C73_864810 [compost metagenome]